MGIDFSKLNATKKKLAERLNQGSGGQKFWRPKAGENVVRILPAWTEEEPFSGQFWREVGQHWGVSEDQAGPLICPKTTPYVDEPCPICEFVEALRSDKSNLEAQALAKDLRAKTAYFLNVIDQADPVYTAGDVAEYKKDRPDKDVPFEVGAPKVQIYAAPSTVFEAIVDIVQTNQLDITDIETGHDITVTKKENKRDRLRTKYVVSPMMRPTPVELPEGFQIPDLSQVGVLKPQEEMAKLLADGKGGEFSMGTLTTGNATAAPSLPSGGRETSFPKNEDDGDSLASALIDAMNE